MTDDQQPQSQPQQQQDAQQQTQGQATNVDQSVSQSIFIARLNLNVKNGANKEDFETKNKK